MAQSNRILPQSKKYFAQRFALWVGLCSLFMAFAGLTSSYIIRRAQPDWLEFNLPLEFFISTVSVILSSVTISVSHHFYKKDEFNKFRIYLILTFLLGCIFTFFQFRGWNAITEQGITMVGKGATISGSFLGVISGWHLVHVLGGLFFLIIAIIRSFIIFRKDPTRSLLKDIQPTKGIRMDLLTTYWHFVDVLWVYLIIFFIVNK